MSSWKLPAALFVGMSLATGTALAQQTQQQEPMQPGQTMQEEMMQHQAPMGLEEQHIREIQEALANAGYDPGEIDGIWGEQTSAAVQEFQEAEGLQGAGELDEDTLALLGLDHLEIQPGAGGPLQTEPGSGAEQPTQQQ
jgi:peptidoglycan hydrolase-like protein with peptidoglycan-binding domain